MGMYFVAHICVISASFDLILWPATTVLSLSSWPSPYELHYWLYLDYGQEKLLTKVHAVKGSVHGLSQWCSKAYFG